MGVFLATRSIGAQKPEKDPPRRVMRFIFHAEPPAAVKLDLESGQLVAQSQIQGFVPNSENAYPMRALREEAQGQQTFQCQIQADLSVICRTADFQPTENAQFFYGTERRLFARTKVLPELADGQPAIGVRFMYRINWRIPADEPDLETGK